MTKNKKCDCGHSKQEHGMIQKSMSTWTFLFSPERFVTLEEGRGACIICHCAEYEPPKKHMPRWGMNYSLREKPTAHEERCNRCGRLLKNHENVNHTFQYDEKTPIR